MTLSVLVISTQTPRGTDAEKDPYQTAQQPAADKSWAYETKFQSFEALLSGSNERNDEADGDGAQSNVQQGIGSCILLTTQTPCILIIIRTTSSE
jgi:hypothetical protein